MNMTLILFYIVIGYFCGSLLFSEISPFGLKRKDPTILAFDHNPGAFNAFRYNGLGWGLFTLLGDLAKGFLPVWLYIHQVFQDSIFYQGLPFVLVAPILGHLYPVFFKFHGGEGISTTFGVLLSLWIGQISAWPVWTLVFLFLALRLLIQIKPDYYLTLVVYLLFSLFTFLEPINLFVWLGIFFISISVLGKLFFLTPKPQQKMEVKFSLWKR